jgi:hypothetical protein
MSWTRAGGVAAVIGGSMWIVKGTAILVSGEQPPVVFGAAPFFLAVGVFGLGRLLASRPGAPASEGLRRAAAIPAYFALALGAATAVAAVASAGDDMPALFDATLGLATLALVLSLILLGLAARRTVRRRTVLRDLPFTLGVLFVPLILLGGVTSVVSERLLEVPVVLLGLAFVALGATLSYHAGDRSRLSKPA